tara:strand:+ start:3952 stop:5379 length:1428 start_codon:yes stop_codon:yes gene_type:complete
MQRDNTQIAVLGVGTTGLAVVRHLRSKGLAPVVLDTRSKAAALPTYAVDALPDELLGLLILWEVVDWPQETLAQVAALVASPGVPLNHSVIKGARLANVTIESDIDLFFASVDQPVLAVTGTNGKSTVVELAAHILNAQGIRCGLGGNIGTPALDLLAGDAQFDAFVLELSSFQLERSSLLTLTSAVVLNLSEDHLDHHETMAAYRAAKQRIYARAQTVVVNPDLVSQFELGTANRIYFSPALLSDSCCVGAACNPDSESGEQWIYAGRWPVCAVDSLPLTGKHNVTNVCAALALVWPVLANHAVDWRRVGESLKAFRGLDHRFQEVARIAGVTYINDSKATNVGATEAALNAFGFDKSLILIAGGDAKGADLTVLEKSFRRCVKHLFTLGKDGHSLHELAKLWKVPSEFVLTLEAAVQRAANLAVTGDTILLSPACASLDMFANYAERGRRFAAAVGGLSRDGLDAALPQREGS